MNFEHITYAVDGAVAVISLNRPEKANAQHFPLLHELNDAWMAAAETSERSASCCSERFLWARSSRSFGPIELTISSRSVGGDEVCSSSTPAALRPESLRPESLRPESVRSEP